MKFATVFALLLASASAFQAPLFATRAVGKAPATKAVAKKKFSFKKAPAKKAPAKKFSLKKAPAKKAPAKKFSLKKAPAVRRQLHARKTFSCETRDIS